MKIKAIIFDKDGTLMDFESFWVTVSRYAIEEMKRATGCKFVPTDEALYSLDVKDGIANINGILAQDPYSVMGRALHGCFEKYGCKLSVDEMTDMAVKAYHRNIDKGEVKAACFDIAGVMDKLKSMGLKLAVVTTDDPYDTEKCLKTLGLYDYFDEIYTDDGIHPAKPDSYACDDFCSKYSLQKNEVIMVGDTLNDVRFARNSGIDVIAVAKNDYNANILREEADAVIRDISLIFSVIQ